MNNKRRLALKEANQLLWTAYNIVSSVLDQENDVLENIPENLQNSERYETAENAIDHLEDAKECLEDANTNIASALEHIDAARN